MEPEDTFQVLADAAHVRSPSYNGDNRGLCPAHGDRNNPGLSFRISNDTGNLIAYCHSRNCTLQSLADAIGVEMGAFFVGSGGTRFSTYVPITWTEMPVLELLKLAPLGYDFDTTVECVFETLQSELEYAERGLSDMTHTELLMLAGIWLHPGYQDGTNWWDWYKKFIDLLFKLNRDTRVDKAAPVSAIPKG